MDNPDSVFVAVTFTKGNRTERLEVYAHEGMSHDALTKQSAAFEDARALVRVAFTDLFAQRELFHQEDAPHA